MGVRPQETVAKRGGQFFQRVSMNCLYSSQLQAGEIDFVCKKPEGQRVYVQASYIISDEATREREFGNLRAIKDNYPKYVISMTPLVGRQDSDGITHIHLRRFLKEGLG